MSGDKYNWAADDYKADSMNWDYDDAYPYVGESHWASGAVYHPTLKTVCKECHTEMYPGGTCDTCGCGEQVTLYFTADGKPIECRNDVPRICLIEGEFPQFEE